MKFPDKYIKKGKFKLHSGQISNIFYDVNAMLTDDDYIQQILEKISFSEHYIGIATGGAIIARVISREREGSKFSMIKDNELKGDLPDKYILIDDVVTTGNSLEKAVKIIGKIPDKIFVVLDRRSENKNPLVYSIFEF